MHLHQLMVFCRVVELKSVTRAAEELILTQPAVSSQVKRLETSLGLELLERFGNEMRTTEAGELLYQYALQILASQGELEKLLDELRKGLRGRIHIAASTTGVMYYLPPFLRSFSETHPGAAITFDAKTTDFVRSGVEDGRFDIGLIWGPMTSEHLTALLLRQDEFTLVFAPGHRFESLDIISPEELRQQRFIMTPDGGTTRRFVEEKLTGVGLTGLKIAMTLSDTEVIKKAVEANLGIGIISKKAAERELKEGYLLSRPVRGLCMRRDILLIHRKSLFLGKTLKEFMDMAVDFFQGPC